MKKVVCLCSIIALSFFSCVTTDSKEAKNIVSDTEQNFEEPESTENEELQQEEKTEILEEKISTDDRDDTAYIPEEKIPDEELAEDIEKLETFEERINESEIFEDDSEITEIIEETKVENNIENTETAQNENLNAKTDNTTVSNTENQTVKTDKEEVKAESTVEETNSFTLQEEASKASEELNEREEEPAPVPSRTVKIKNNQFLDINYPGTGWIYLGETERKGQLIFFGRKIHDSQTTFTLQSKKSGTAILHFYKNDPLSGKYIDDYIQVEVEVESATDNEHVQSPDYAAIVPPKPVKKIPAYEENETENEEIIIPSSKNSIASKETDSTKAKDDSILDIQTIIQNADTNTNSDNRNKTEVQKTDVKITSETTDIKSLPVTADGDLLEQAQKAYDEKKYQEALSLVKAFFTDASDRIDEALYLEARIFEASSPVQNIKESISDYDTIVSKWPMSKLWQKAKERSIYLRRFYIDIR